MNFSRCAMSRSVIGEPFTSRTICWARAGNEIVAIIAKMKRAVAKPLHRCRDSTGEITSFFPSRRKSVGNANRSQRVRPKGAQAELQHDGVISDRKRHRRIGIAAEPVHRQHEAIVDIADAKPRLVEAIIFDVVARRPKQNPISCQFHRSTGKEAFATREEAEERLGRIVAIEKLQRPALEISARLDFEALWGERALVE